MAQKLTVAVIGCGGFAQAFVPLYQNHPYVEKVYVCDIIPERAQDYSRKFNVEIIDTFEDAIARRKKITFNYFHLNEKAERVYVTTRAGRKKRYSIELVALIFNEDNYYLMGYSSRHPGTTANYRIDRMDHVELVEDAEFSKEALARIDGVAAFTEEAFKMFGGERETVVLRFDKQLIGPVFDKFGEDTPDEVG